MVARRTRTRTEDTPRLSESDAAITAVLSLKVCRRFVSVLRRDIALESVQMLWVVLSGTTMHGSIFWFFSESYFSWFIYEK